MNIFKVYIKAFDLNPGRYQILQTGVKYLYSYLSQVLRYANQQLNHKLYDDALITYGSHINHADLSSDEHLLLHITPESYARKFLGSQAQGAAGITTLLGKDMVFSEIMWSFIEAADNKGLALANYAFHELVHNKAFSAYPEAGKNGSFVHNESGSGVLVKILEPGQAGSIIANSENIKAMAMVYFLRIKQYRRYLIVEPKTK